MVDDFVRGTEEMDGNVSVVDDEAAEPELNVPLLGVLLVGVVGVVEERLLREVEMVETSVVS